MEGSRKETGDRGRRGERKEGGTPRETDRTDLREKPEEMEVLPVTFSVRGNDIPGGKSFSRSLYPQSKWTNSWLGG